MNTKICKNCLLEKNVAEFYYIKKSQQYNKTCRACEFLLRKQREQSVEFLERKKLETENQNLLKLNKRKCKICFQIKDLSDFYFRKEQQRYRLECKCCMLEKQKSKKPISIKKVNDKKRKVNECKHKSNMRKKALHSKICKNCNIDKPIHEFRKNKQGYIYTVCKKCEYKQNMERYYKRKMQNEHYKMVYDVKQNEESLLLEHKKQCLVCFKIKDLSEFYFRRDLNKYRSWCKECEKQRTNTFYNENKDEILNKQHKYYKDNRKVVLQRKKDYANTHKEQLREYHTKYVFNRRNTDDVFRFKSQIRHLINQSFRRQGKQKKGKTEVIVGCDFQTLYNHLLQTYRKTYGTDWDGVEKVHIDHIIPLATVDNVDDIIKLCHYTNLQLLKETDNLVKGDKIDWNLEKNN